MGERREDLRGDPRCQLRNVAQRVYDEGGDRRQQREQIATEATEIGDRVEHIVHGSVDVEDCVDDRAVAAPVGPKKHVRTDGAEIGFRRTCGERLGNGIAARSTAGESTQRLASLTAGKPCSPRTS